MKNLSLALLVAGLGAWHTCTAHAAAPKVSDPAYELSLFAQAPDIVTPTGVATDERDRLFVIESHTHMPPAGYAGPPHDRVKIFSDVNNDGRGELISVFADGPFRDAMNLAFVKPGHLIVVTRDAVVALFDKDHDDRAETQVTLLRLESPNRYPHSGLLGVAVSRDGWLYVSRGNIGGAPYTYVGSDGRRLAGMGTGGDIVRVRLDGGGLTLVATGFWNPFGLHVDRRGRLWATDNDPNSRGPNRLLHIIAGGDYGFAARYGNSGLHPHVAWNGELPGTLGYVGGTGESPGGLLTKGEREMWVASWADNRIERFSLSNAGATFRGKRDNLIEGDASFRPVGLASATSGDVFISDWVHQEYPNHGDGRLWRLRRRAPGLALTPVPRLAPLEIQMQRLLTSSDAPLRWRRFACGNDDFVRAAFVFRLATRPDSITSLAASPKPCERLAALLALRWRRLSGETAVFDSTAWLADEDVDVRQVALRWVGETLERKDRSSLRKAIAQAVVSPSLVRGYLATEQLYAEPPPRVWSGAWPDNAAQAPPGLVQAFVKDESLPEEVRALALLQLTKASPDQVDWLIGLVHGPSPRMRLPALRALPQTTVASNRLIGMAKDPNAAVPLRLTAIAQVAVHPNNVKELLPLLRDPEADVAILVARSLRVFVANPAVRAAFEQRQAEPADPRLAAALAFALSPAATLESRSKDVQAYNKSLEAGGDPLLGQFVFRHPGVGCTRCHSIDGQGGRLGPPLDQIGLSTDRTRITQSILQPSAELSPEFQVYVVTLKDGTVLEGTQLHWNAAGDVATLELQTGEIRALRTIARVDTPSNSFMPEGLGDLMTAAEMQDLIAYLQSRGHASALSTKQNIFDGRTLHGWVGRPDLWRIERPGTDSAAIVGRVAGDLPHNEFLIYSIPVSDFRLQAEVLLESAGNNSGLQFRSARIRYEDGHEGVRGYQADIGGPADAYWGRLYHERGRQWLTQETLSKGIVKPNDYNSYEILAIGSRIITAINGHVASCIDDPRGEARGLIALQLHGGIPAKVSFRNVVLDDAPTSQLLTAPQPASCVAR